MKIANLAALIVRPREPYLRWAAGLGWEDPDGAESLGTEVSIYLVPEDETGTHETPPIEDFY